MKTLTVRLPEAMVAKIEAESRRRKLTKSDIVRERLQAAAGPQPAHSAGLDGIGDLIGSVDGLPGDLSSRRRHYLKSTRYGRKRPR
jgi:hypothetical protein